MRLLLALADKSDWVKVFDPRAGGVFVTTQTPPAVGTEVRVDLTITEGPRVILKGNVLFTRPDGDGTSPGGCSVGLALTEREKVNFLNGFVRGGLINRRERRRLPLRMPVTYGGVDGAKKSWSRDINEEGIFIVSEHPLPEGTVLHFVLEVPGRKEPLHLKGKVTHTVIVEDEDVPGMGIVFELPPATASELVGIVDDLEARFMAGTLPEEVIT